MHHNQSVYFHFSSTFFFEKKNRVIAIVWSSFPRTLPLPSKNFNIDHNFFLLSSYLARQEHYIKIDLHFLMTL